MLHSTFESKQQGSNLHISAEGASGDVIVQNFFSQENSLNLTLPEYNSKMQKISFNEISNDNAFIGLRDGFQYTPMMIDLVDIIPLKDIYGII